MVGKVVAAGAEEEKVPRVSKWLGSLKAAAPAAAVCCCCCCYSCCCSCFAGRGAVPDQTNPIFEQIAQTVSCSIQNNCCFLWLSPQMPFLVKFGWNKTAPWSTALLKAVCPQKKDPHAHLVLNQSHLKDNAQTNVRFFLARVGNRLYTRYVTHLLPAR